MCDQGHTLYFDSEKCETRKEGSGRLVATIIRTDEWDDYNVAFPINYKEF